MNTTNNNNWYARWTQPTTDKPDEHNYQPQLISQMNTTNTCNNTTEKPDEHNQTKISRVSWSSNQARQQQQPSVDNNMNTADANALGTT